MSLASDILASPNVCTLLTTVFNTWANIIGGGDRALAFLYMFFFVVLPMLMLGLGTVSGGKSILMALLGGFVGNTILLLLMNSACLTVSPDYISFYWVFEIMLISFLLVAALKKT